MIAILLKTATTRKNLKAVIGFLTEPLQSVFLFMPFDFHFQTMVTRRFGRPTTVTTDTNVSKIRYIIEETKRMKVWASPLLNQN